LNLYCLSSFRYNEIQLCFSFHLKLQFDFSIFKIISLPAFLTSLVSLLLLLFYFLFFYFENKTKGKILGNNRNIGYANNDPKWKNVVAEKLINAACCPTTIFLMEY